MVAETERGRGDLELHMRFMGDWGIANFHTAAGWLAAGMRWRTAPGSSYVIHTMGGLDESLDRVADGSVDLGIVTPIVTAAMYREGRGLFDTPHRDICAIGALPHRDRLCLAIGEDVAEKYGIRTFEDIAAKHPPLKLATSRNEAGNPIGLAIEQILKGYGIAWDDIPAWGGEWIEVVRPPYAIPLVASGKADGIFYEAVMTWHAMTRQRQLRFLPISDRVLTDLHDRYGFERVDIDPDEYPGVTEPVPVVDFSQWLLVVRRQMADEVANMLTHVVVEDRADLEGKFRSRPAKESPLSYPIEPSEVWKTAPVPLHAGAEQAYRELGLIS